MNAILISCSTVILLMLLLTNILKLGNFVITISKVKVFQDIVGQKVKFKIIGMVLINLVNKIISFRSTI